MLVVILARTRSKRLPAKALLKIQGVETARYLIQRLKQSDKISEIILATGKSKADNYLAGIAVGENISLYRGFDTDPANRFIHAAMTSKNKDLNVIRITGDDIITDIDCLHRMIDYHKTHNPAGYTICPDLPRGCEADIIYLPQFMSDSRLLSDGEMMNEVVRNSQYTKTVYIPSKYRHPKLNLTIDTAEDFRQVNTVLSKFIKDGNSFPSVPEIILYLRSVLKFKPTYSKS
jgi:spore coat polysaccharide biosynthesis protein SpsF